eukprot:1156676-Pelagomonas_calceolata.AAC.6
MPLHWCKCTQAPRHHALTRKHMPLLFVPYAEGVLEATKDFNLPRHSEELDVPNLQVIKLMQSFTSLEYVTERFAWRHYYWCAQLLHAFFLGPVSTRTSSRPFVR